MCKISGGSVTRYIFTFGGAGACRNVYCFWLFAISFIFLYNYCQFTKERHLEYKLTCFLYL